MKLIKRVLKSAGEYRGRIIIGLIATVLKELSMGLMLGAVFYFFGEAHGSGENVVFNCIILMVTCVILRFLFQWISNICLSGEAFRIFRNYRIDVGNRLKNAPMGYFSDNSLGTIQGTVTTTVEGLETYLMMAITDMVGGISMASVIVIMCLIASPIIGVVSALGLVAGILVLRIISNAGMKYSKMMLDAQEGLVTSTIQHIRGISVLRAFNGKSEVGDEMKNACRMQRDAQQTLENASAFPFQLYRDIFKVASAFIMMTAVILRMNGSINSTYCLTFIVSSFIIYSGLTTLGNGTFLNQKLHVELERIDEILDIPEMDSSTEYVDITDRDIDIENVTFAYDKRTVVNNVSMKIPEKSKIAIVGPSGSGKTTICNLITRFWDVDEGSIKLGKRDIREIPLQQLLSKFSMVFQDVYLFNDTVANNIAFGKQTATREEIVEAAKKAKCHEFIEKMPDGYDTVLGEGGATISGGEKQRISIARAILKDSPIIILDEATSSIDPENEHEILEAIGELTKDKTVISIAHRLTTVRNADKIFVIDNGEIVQQGTHEELVGEEGIYSRFIKLRADAIGWNILTA